MSWRRRGSVVEALWKRCGSVMEALRQCHEREALRQCHGSVVIVPQKRHAQQQLSGRYKSRLGVGLGLWVSATRQGLALGSVRGPAQHFDQVRVAPPAQQPRAIGGGANAHVALERFAAQRVDGTLRAREVAWAIDYRLQATAYSLQAVCHRL